jgi:pyrroline-5-carboxylate reductase
MLVAHFIAYWVKKETPAVNSKLWFIGYGNMGQALSKLLSLNQCKDLNGFTYDITICDRFSPKEWNESWGEHVSFPYLSSSQLQNQAPPEFKDTDIVVLAFKPQNLAEAVACWRPFLGNSPQKPLLVSILAGTPLEALECAWGPDFAVVRAMTNIAAKVGYASTTLSPNHKVNPQQLEATQLMFGYLGKVWNVPESFVDVVTAVSGGGPAYVYMFIEALSDGGVKMGLPRKLAQELATQTVLGAAQLLSQSGMHPAILREQVTTPGGITIDALHELEKAGMRSMLISAVCVATQKGEKLREINQNGRLQSSHARNSYSS